MSGPTASNRRRRLLAASVSALMVAMPHAQGFERVVIGIDHFVDCAGLMLRDPAQHAANCLPNRVKTPFTTLGTTNTMPPPPPPVEDEPVDCGPTDCGPVDCGPADCGPVDCGPVDCGPTDCGPADCGPSDA